MTNLIKRRKPLGTKIIGQKEIDAETWKVETFLKRWQENSCLKIYMICCGMLCPSVLEENYKN